MRNIKALSLLILVGFSSVYPSAAVADNKNGADCSIADTAIGVASKIRKLEMVHAVPCSLQDKAAVEKYLRDTLDEKIPDWRMKYEGKVYELLGIIPPGYDYINNVIKLYTEQLGGYYDPEKQAYVMANWMPAMMQMPIAVHELTHALQDQHFHLEAMLDEKNATSDTLLARSSLVEGDATAVMLDYQRGEQGQGSIAGEESISSFLIQNISGAMLSSSVGQAPSALRAMLIFPYVSGLNFVHALLRKGDYAEVDKAFTRLPETSAEILHPNEYLSGKRNFVELALPAPNSEPGKKAAPAKKSEKSADDKKSLFDDRLGEFVVSSLLSTYVTPAEASAAAAGWRGDRIALYQLPDERHLALFWDLHCSSNKAAKKLFDTLRAAYEKRFSAASSGEDNGFRFDHTVVGDLDVLLKGQELRITIRTSTPAI